MSRLNHYACDIEHPRGRGRPWPGNHRPGCPVAEGHDLGAKISSCRACAREYRQPDFVPAINPFVATPKVRRRRADHPHYACVLPPEAHPVQRGVGRDHRAGCQVAEGHEVGAAAGSMTCRACRAATQRRTWRAGVLRREFGLTVAQYEERLQAQNGVCAICGQKQEKSLAVDHSHESGALRGLLCKTCNLGLGTFNENPERLRSAAAYLERWASPKDD